MPAIFPSHLSIRARLALGFGALCALLLLIGTIALWGYARLNHHVERFNRLSDEARLLVEVDRMTSEIQRNVVRFMHEGYVSAGESALQQMQKLKAKLDSTGKLSAIDSQQTLPILQSMREHLDLYESTFREAFKERQIYDAIILTTLPGLANQIRAAIAQYHTHPQVNYPIEPKLLFLAKAEARLVTYFEGLEARNAEQSLLQLQALLNYLQERLRSDPPALRPELDQISALVDQYRETAVRAIQATRSILYLINVVMSGEASEILYKSAKIRDQSLQQQGSVQQQLTDLTSTINTSLAAISLLTVLGGIAYAVLIGLQITAPLLRITETFRALNKGQSDAPIPAYHRKDEIGDLIAAASILKQRNLQTEQLLAQSEVLTAQLQDSQRDLETKNKELEQFVYTVSHDLKSPVVTSVGFIGMIRELARQGKTAEAIAKLDRVEKANLRMGELINDLLELSRVPRVDLQRSAIDTRHEIEQVLQALAPQLKANGFAIDVSGDFPPVLANPSRFRQIFENLLTNAMKYGKASPPHPNRIVLCADAMAEPDALLIHVRDFGPGIPVAFRDKVFGLFTRLQNEREGTGIGLAVVRKLMDIHNGRVWIDSPEDGPGARFNLAFPRPKPD